MRSLSRTEARVVLSLEASGRDAVMVSEIRALARVSAPFARKLAHDLDRKGWLQRVRRGVYLVNPGRYGPERMIDTDPLRIGNHLVSPYYFGYGTAAELLGLLPQAGRTYYLVSPTRASWSESRVARFRRVHCSPHRFFGTRTLTRRGETVVVSDQERTVLDCLDRPEFAGGLPGAVKVLASAKPQVDWDRLGRYLTRLANRSLELRLGYLAELVRPEVPVPAAWVRRRLPERSEPYVPLDPSRDAGRRGTRNRRWHVIENLPLAKVLGEVMVR